MEDIKKIIDINYIKENGKHILKEVIYNGITSQNSKIVHGIDDEMKIDNSERILKIHKLGIYDILCKLIMGDQYSLCSILSGLSFTEILIKNYKDKLQRYNESFIWSGEGVWDGLIKIIGKDKDVVDASIDFNKEESYIKKLEVLMNKAKEEINDNKIVVFCSYKFFKEYTIELKNNGIEIESKPYTGGFSILIPDSNITLIASNGIDNDIEDYVILTTIDNIIIGTDLTHNIEEFNVSFDDKCDGCNNSCDCMSLKIIYCLGAQYNDPKKIVRGYSL